MHIFISYLESLIIITGISSIYISADCSWSVHLFKTILYVFCFFSDFCALIFFVLTIVIWYGTLITGYKYYLYTLLEFLNLKTEPELWNYLSARLWVSETLCCATLKVSKMKKKNEIQSSATHWNFFFKESSLIQQIICMHFLLKLKAAMFFSLIKNPNGHFVHDNLFIVLTFTDLCTIDSEKI